MNENQSRVIDACYSLLDNARYIFQIDLPIPIIVFSDRMTHCAGTYSYNPNSKCSKITFSNYIMEHNDVQAFIEDTVIHEMAHFIDRMKYGSLGHTDRFFSIMKLLGHKNPTRCHTFKTAPRKTHPYQCQKCGHIIELGAIRHSKFINKKRLYYHTACGGGLIKPIQDWQICRIIIYSLPWKRIMPWKSEKALSQ